MDEHYKERFLRAFAEWESTRSESAAMVWCELLRTITYGRAKLYCKSGVEDALQDSFVAILKFHKDWKNRESLAWIYKIVISESIKVSQRINKRRKGAVTFDINQHTIRDRSGDLVEIEMQTRMLETLEFAYHVIFPTSEERTKFELCLEKNLTRKDIAVLFETGVNELNAWFDKKKKELVKFCRRQSGESGQGLEQIELILVACPMESAPPLPRAELARRVHDAHRTVASQLRRQYFTYAACAAVCMLTVAAVIPTLYERPAEKQIVSGKSDSPSELLVKSIDNATPNSPFESRGTEFGRKKELILRGRVVTANGEKLPSPGGVSVSPVSGDKHFAPLNTDSDGVFVYKLDQLPSDLTLNLNAGDYYSEFALRLGPNTCIGLAPGTIQLPAISLLPTGVLESRVLTVDGKPAQNVYVELETEQLERTTYCGQTDNFGKLKIAHVPPGIYHGTAYTGYVESKISELPFQIRAGETTDLGSVPVHLPNYQNLRIRLLLNRNGVEYPLAGAKVASAKLRKDGILSDESGCLLLPVPENIKKVSLVVNHPSLRNSLAKELVIDPASTVQLIHLEPAPEIQVSVSDAEAPTRRPVLSSAWLGTRLTNRVVCDDKSQLSRGMATLLFRGGAQGNVDSTLIVFSAGFAPSIQKVKETQRFMNISLSRGGVLSGCVENINKIGISDARVVLKYLDFPLEETSTNENGEFRFDHVPAGSVEFTLEIQIPGAPPYSVPAPLVREREVIAVPRICMKPTARIRLSMDRDEEAARIVLFVSPGDNRQHYLVQIDPGGVCEVPPLFVGDYAIKCVCSTGMGSSSTELLLWNGSLVFDQDIHLSTRETGRLVCEMDRSGLNPDLFSVVLFTGERHHYEFTLSDANGKFIINSLKEGEQDLFVVARGSVSNARIIENIEQEKNVRERLRKISIYSQKIGIMHLTQ